MKKGQWIITMVMAAGFMLASSARAGSLTPPGAPGPTMYTLEEIYQQLLTTQQDLLTIRQQASDLEARMNADGKHITSGDMVLIPAGEFVMGACTNVGQEAAAGETPQHTVYVSAFYMDKYEVTSNLWTEVYTWATNYGYSFGTNWSAKAADHPVQQVDWYDAIAWCNARSQQAGFTPCYTNANGTVYTNSTGNFFTGDCNWNADGYRLPTEAEWEKAARGGVANRRFPWDDVNTIQHARANYWVNFPVYSYDTNPTTGPHPGAGGTDPLTMSVGSFAPNGYGLYDMAGNVLEWCWDLYQSDYYSTSPSINPRGPDEAPYRVLRGGSWQSSAFYARCASRYWGYLEDVENNYFGFRCARGL